MICTTRRKQEFSQDSINGKTVITKLGSKAIDVSFEVTNKHHYAISSKDRTKLFDGKPEFIITEETGKILVEWANKGESDMDVALAMVREANDVESLGDIFRAFPNLKEDVDLISACKARKQFLTELSN